MRSLFSFAKKKCSRCDHENTRDANYCSECGLMVGSPVHDTVMRQQRWLPADNELAIFFAVRTLRQLATQSWQIPARSRAFIMQNRRSMELPAGDYDIAAFLAKTPQLDADQSAEILLTRSLPFALLFNFDALHCAQFLPLQASCLLRLKIENTDVFSEHFMSAPGTLTTSDLEQLFHDLVRVPLQAWLSQHSLRELQDRADLLTQLNEHLLSCFNASLATYGLAATQVVIKQLSHQKLNREREHQAEQEFRLDLLIDGKKLDKEKTQQLDALYSEKEWQSIAKQEEQVRLRYRHEEMRQAFKKDLGWLYIQGEHEQAKKRLSRAKLKQDEADRLQTIRLRELALYASIAEAKDRKEAIDAGAVEMVRELEHQARAKSEQRQQQADVWLHVRTLARIKMRAESELAQLQAQETNKLLQQQIAHKIDTLQLEHEIAQSRLIADQEQQREQMQILQAKQVRLAQREHELEEERHQHALIQISLATEIRAREFQRTQEWEQALQQERHQNLQREQHLKEAQANLQRERIEQEAHALERQTEQAHAVMQQEKLQRTLELQARFEQQEQQRQHQAAVSAAEIEESRMRTQRDLQQQEMEQSWRQQREMAESAQQQQLALAKLEIERLNAIAQFSETGKIATANPQNAQALTEILKLQTQAGMSAEQILATQAGQSMHAAQAMSAMASLEQGMSLEQTMKILQDRLREERDQRELELQRRHQIDLTISQGLAQSLGQGRANW
ncbi:zinc ribbon domain-containing protein [Undibacterium fentianense]|uniref:Uncharacterized protein n=1 Tax=Undibacterium fentianense TaxID=2828728 RepID=A0A941IGV8_9BURK|nr:zinc ribbon domain-containing protein [Undibacterium fentianense]MBR7800385.1 hypothetical protein [Undibacterium fentianense]